MIPLNLDVTFTGTQKGMVEAQKENFARLMKHIAPKRVRIGDCIGADAHAHEIILRLAWALRYWTRPELVGHPPDKSDKRAFLKYDVEVDPLPYRVRDRIMAETSDFTIATPRSMQEELRSGTWATARDSARAQKGVLILWPDGTMSDWWPSLDDCPVCRAPRVMGQIGHYAWCFRKGTWFMESFNVVPFTFKYAHIFRPRRLYPDAPDY